MAHDRALGVVERRVVLCDGGRDNHSRLTLRSTAFFGRCLSTALSRSNSSTAMTTITGRSYLVTMTGAARARSISSPKLFLASAEVMERILAPFEKPVLAELDNYAIAEFTASANYL